MDLECNIVLLLCYHYPGWHWHIWHIGYIDLTQSGNFSWFVPLKITPPLSAPHCMLPPHTASLIRTSRVTVYQRSKHFYCQYIQIWVYGYEIDDDNQHRFVLVCFIKEWRYIGRRLIRTIFCWPWPSRHHWGWREGGNHWEIICLSVQLRIIIFKWCTMLLDNNGTSLQLICCHLEGESWK